MLSIIVPTIRLENWKRLYISICNSISSEFELLLIGPRYSTELEDHKNVKFIQGFGSPNRCQQIGLINARGEHVTWAADDCVYQAGMLDKCIGLLKDKKDIVVARYSEGDGDQSYDEYYKLYKAYPDCSYINKDWWMLNCGVMHREYLVELGGFDTGFQIPAFGYADLSVRTQADGANIILLKEKVLHCDHGQADHRPIEIAHVYEDTPYYKYLYSSGLRTKIDINNWMEQPEIWSKR